MGTSGAPDGERSWALDALDHLGDGVIVIDAEANLVYRNACAERLVGVTGMTPTPATWSEQYGIFASDERTVFPNENLPLVRALGGETIVDCEIFVRNAAVPDGVHLLVNAGPLHDGTRRVGAFTIFHDITVRRTHELQLREAERQKKAILDNIPDMAWLKDRDGKFLAVNEPLSSSAGLKRPEDAIGLTDLDLWPRELAERYRADDAYVMKSKREKRVEEPFVDVSGRTYWIETIKRPIVSDSGEVIGSTGIARDVTERKRNEEALRDNRDELERRVTERTAELAEAQESLVRKERLAVLGQLAGGVAHQIRNPLAAIMNATYVLKRHLLPEQHPNVEDAIRIIHDEVRHANVIITGLLDHARVRAPDRHPASLVEIVDKALAAEGVPSTITVERAIEDVPLLEVDADQLQGAFFNVIRNAVEAMPAGGVLGVDLGRRGDEIVLGVSDTGCGISAQVRAHLFEPLHSTKPMGIGLGLVTARTLVEAHGGRISCIEVPVGARFEIRLPAA